MSPYFCWIFKFNLYLFLEVIFYFVHGPLLGAFLLMDIFVVSNVAYGKYCWSAGLPACDFFFFSNGFIATLFIYLFWLCWVFVSCEGFLQLRQAGATLHRGAGGYSSSRCAGLSPSRPLPLLGTGSRRAGSAVVAHGPSCSVACGIFPDQGSNPCPLH